ncbi:Amuc_1099 family pilus-like system protein [Haloferula sp. BvORR071]|uniref:Amuc_1099 family pilus-like system protein n=1 Tax=Haloferula sp. BvORR071 TaxID=1396141 RepID=UPI0006965A57|nr:Amuc_1099 family pilus-like system protein [Haloferula sp. BvORR071]
MNPSSEDPSERLIDSLLRKQARGAADEELLKAIEQKLDAAAPAPVRSKGRGAAWASMAAAAAVVCGGAGVYFSQQAAEEKVNAVASRAPSEAKERSIVAESKAKTLHRLPPAPVADSAAAEGSTEAAAAAPKFEFAAKERMDEAAPVIPESGREIAQLPAAPSTMTNSALSSPGAMGGSGGGSGVGGGRGAGVGRGFAGGGADGSLAGMDRDKLRSRSGGEAKSEEMGGMLKEMGIPEESEKARAASMAQKAKSVVDDEIISLNPNLGNTERYGQLVDQPWKSPWQDALSTFSIDVDTASYTNLRRMIQEGRPVPPDAVRIEECVNYFDYKYEGPKGDGPFAVHGTLATCPWKEGHLLARVAIKGKEMAKNARPASNLVFLIDVSGSMQSPDKLPLLKRSMRVLIDQLDERDRVAMVVYAGTEGVALDSTVLDERGKSAAIQALEKLESGGSTNGGAGIKRAYELATKGRIQGGTNRVILATDGDFNVGTTGQGDLVNLVKGGAKGGVSLSVLGFGTGNLNDSMMEAISKDGDGNYFYVNGDEEARRVFGEKLTGTLVTIAKDVKIQVEFNPGKVQAYRLIGYADRILRHEDFNNDKVDAGDIGAGHTVTAFYEIVPDGVPMPNAGTVDTLRYQRPAGREVVNSEDWFALKLRHKHPEGDTSALIETPVKGEPVAWESAGNDFRFASAVALFGMKLRQMPELADMSWGKIEQIAKPALAEDPQEQRAGFIETLRKIGKYDPTALVNVPAAVVAKPSSEVPEIFKDWGYLRDESTKWYVTFGLMSDGMWAPKLLGQTATGQKFDNRVSAASMISPGDVFFLDKSMAGRFKFNGIVRRTIHNDRTGNDEEMNVALYEDLKESKKGRRYESQEKLPENEIEAHAYYDRTAVFGLKAGADAEALEVKVEEGSQFALPPNSGKKEFFLREVAEDHVTVEQTDGSGVKQSYTIRK